MFGCAAGQVCTWRCGWGTHLARTRFPLRDEGPEPVTGVCCRPTAELRASGERMTKLPSKGVTQKARKRPYLPSSFEYCSSPSVWRSGWFSSYLLLAEVQGGKRRTLPALPSGSDEHIEQKPNDHHGSEEHFNEEQQHAQDDDGQQLCPDHQRCQLHRGFVKRWGRRGWEQGGRWGWNSSNIRWDTSPSVQTSKLYLHELGTLCLKSPTPERLHPSVSERLGNVLTFPLQNQ